MTPVHPRRVANSPRACKNLMMRSLFHITEWEKVSLGRRVLCASVRVAVLFALLTALGYMAFANRYRIEAKTWHWQHGYSATMGNYVVPVPEHWLILNQDSIAFTMVNLSPTYPRQDGKFHTAAIITVSPLSNPLFDADKMNLWLLLRRQWLARDGVRNVQEKALKFGDEVVTCIGGNELSAIAHAHQTPNARIPEMDILSLDCMSDHGLHILFVGEPSDLQPFYAFVSQIRIHS